MPDSISIKLPIAGRALFLGATLVAASSLLAPTLVLAQSAEKKSAPAATEVKLAKAATGEIARNIALPASIVANQQVTLFSKATGYLKTIKVDKGDEVQKGDLIAEIEAPELLADITKFKAEVDIAELEYKRVNDAQKKSPDLIMAQSLDTAKSRVAVAKANLERAETLLSFCKISAPFAGVITRRFVDPGAFVPAATAGSATQTAAIVTLVDFNTVRVQIPVPELEASRVKKDLPVNVTVEGLPGKTFAGKITRSTQVLDDVTRTMLVEADLPNENTELRPGMYAIARVAIEKHSNTILLPVSAVLIEKAGVSVFTIDSGKAKKTPVKVGFNDGTNIEVLSGVQAGDAVISFGKTPPANGQAVIATEAK